MANNTPAYGHEVDYLYRLEDKRYSVVVDAEQEIYSSKTVIQVYRYKVIKTTAYGWQVDSGFSNTRFVRMDARKVFAAPSYEKALESYLARKARQAGIYYARAEAAERCAFMAKQGKYDATKAQFVSELQDAHPWDFTPSRQPIKKD